MDEALAWAEKNPWWTGGIILVGGLAFMWMLGMFGGSKGGASAANNAAAQQTEANLATAYYAAEAANATAGTQLQLAQVQGDTAVNIASANDQAAIATNAADNTTAQLGYTTGLSAAQTQYNDMVAANAANTSAAVQTAQITGNAANFNSLTNTILPYELALSGGAPVYANIAGTTYGLGSTGYPTISPYASIAQYGGIAPYTYL